MDESIAADAPVFESDGNTGVSIDGSGGKRGRAGGANSQLGNVVNCRLLTGSLCDTDGGPTNLEKIK